MRMPPLQFYDISVKEDIDVQALCSCEVDLMLCALSEYYSFSSLSSFTVSPEQVAPLPPQGRVMTIQLSRLEWYYFVEF